MDRQMTADVLPHEKMDSNFSVFIWTSENYKKQGLCETWEWTDVREKQEDLDQNT